MTRASIFYATHIGNYIVLNCRTSVLRLDRALGFDTCVLRLNSNIDWVNAPPPFLIAKCIRHLTYPIRMAVKDCRTASKVFARCLDNCRNVDEEEDRGRLKDAENEALREYQKTLANTFNDEDCIHFIMASVRFWTNDE